MQGRGPSHLTCLLIAVPRSCGLACLGTDWLTKGCVALREQSGEWCPWIQGDIPLEASLLPTCGAVWGWTDFSCSSQNISGALMRGPLRVRLSLPGTEQPDHQEGEFDRLTEAAAQMKAILKDVRSWLELGCGSS